MYSLTYCAVIHELIPIVRVTTTASDDTIANELTTFSQTRAADVVPYHVMHGLIYYFGDPQKSSSGSTEWYGSGLSPEKLEDILARYRFLSERDYSGLGSG